MTREPTIVVGVKQVPADDEIRIDPDTGRIDGASASATTNSPDTGVGVTCKND
jgi:electron transfer flavoprotein beta subunit